MASRRKRNPAPRELSRAELVGLCRERFRLLAKAGQLQLRYDALRAAAEVLHADGDEGLLALVLALCDDAVEVAVDALMSDLR